MAKKEKVYGTHLKVSTKRAGHKIGGTVGIFVFLLVLALFMALPIYLAVVMSLKPVQELFVFPPKLYVIDPTLSNYSAMFRLCSDLWVPFSRYVFNSIFVTVSVTVCQVIFSAMAAFCLAKVRFPGAKAINAIIVVALLYQSNVIYIMQYMVMAKMGMIDTYWALILPSVAAPMNLFLMRQSMTQVPDAMIEAAKVDGAGNVPHLLAGGHAEPEAGADDCHHLLVPGGMEHPGRYAGIQRIPQDPAHRGAAGSICRSGESRRGNGGRRVHAGAADRHLHAGTAAGHRDHGTFRNQGLREGEDFAEKGKPSGGGSFFRTDADGSHRRSGGFGGTLQRL